MKYPPILPANRMRRPQINALARDLRRQDPHLTDREALTLAKRQARP